MVDNSIIYAEVYEILSYMEKSKVMKIPLDILYLFKNERNLNYISRIDKNDIFNKNNVELKTKEIIAWLNLEYWVNSEEKENLIKKYRQNEIENQNSQPIIQLQNNFNNKVQQENISQEKQLVEIQKNIIIRIFEFIKNIIKR